jgi:hypothetical protein
MSEIRFIKDVLVGHRYRFIARGDVTGVEIVGKVISVEPSEWKGGYTVTLDTGGISTTEFNNGFWGSIEEIQEHGDGQLPAWAQAAIDRRSESGS